MNELPQPAAPARRTIPHYYGDIVRVLFFTAGLMMVLSLPFFQENIDLPIYLSILATLVLVFLAGLTNPKHIWIAYLNLVVSVVGFAVFEYKAVITFGEENVIFVAINQFLALVFFAALYFSVKTWRGFVLRNERV